MATQELNLHEPLRALENLLLSGIPELNITWHEVNGLFLEIKPPRAGEKDCRVRPREFCIGITPARQGMRNLSITHVRSGDVRFLWILDRGDCPWSDLGDYVLACDQGLQEIFQKEPAFAISQPLAIHGVPTYWHSQCFFDININPTLESKPYFHIRFESYLCCGTKRKKKTSHLDIELEHDDSFNNLVYAYYFNDAPVAPIQDYIQERLV